MDVDVGDGFDVRLDVLCGEVEVDVLCCEGGLPVLRKDLCCFLVVMCRCVVRFEDGNVVVFLGFGGPFVEPELKLGVGVFLSGL